METTVYLQSEAKKKKQQHTHMHLGKHGMMITSKLHMCHVFKTIKTRTFSYLSVKSVWKRQTDTPLLCWKKKKQLNRGSHLRRGSDWSSLAYSHYNTMIVDNHSSLLILTLYNWYVFIYCLFCIIFGIQKLWKKTLETSSLQAKIRSSVVGASYLWRNTKHWYLIMVQY